MADKSTHPNHESTQPSTGDRPKYLPQPCDVNSWFIFDLLAALFVASGILAGLFLLRGGIGTYFTPPAPGPLQLFVGNGVALILAASIMSVTIVMAIIHVRFLVAEPGDFRFLGIVGLILILANGVIIGFTMNQFYTVGIGGVFFQVLSVQAVLVLVTLYYSAMLKSELMQRMYEQTTSVAIAKLHMLTKLGSSSAADRDWLRHIRQSRSDELGQLEKQLRNHLQQLETASREFE